MEELEYPVLAIELDGTPPDDFRDEEDALDILNEQCEGVYIAFVDGDLLCLKEEEEPTQ